jgi:O-antigen/teichoic acid export membrane protein
VSAAAVKALQIAASFVFMPFLLRGFGLANYGVFVLASSVSVYLGLLDFGVSSTVTKFVAEHRARNEDVGLGRVVSNVVAYYTAVGILACVGLLLFARFGVGIFRLRPADMVLARDLFTVSGVVALFAWPLGIGSSVLGGLQRYDLSARIGALVVVGNVAVSAIVVWLHSGPVQLLAAMGAVALVGGIASCAAARGQLGPAVPLSWGLVRRSTMERLLRFSWPIFVIQVTSMATDMQTDRLVLATFVGASAVGVYESASKLNGLVGQLSPLPTVALVPMAAKLDAEERPEALRALFLRGTKYTVGFVVPIAVGLMALARPLLLHWLGPDFVAQAFAAQVFLLVWVFFANLSVAFTIFIGTGRLRFLMWFNVATAILNLVLSVILVQRLGVLGVIIGTVAVELGLFPIGMWYVLRTLEVSPGEYLRSVVLRTYPLLLVPIGIAWASMATGLTATLPGVAIAGLSAVASYWVAFYFLGLTGHERAEVGQLVASVVGRTS